MRISWDSLNLGREPGTIFYIGCCDPKYFAEWHRDFGQSKLIGFEPDPENYQKFPQGPDHTPVHQAAVGSRPGTAVFYYTTGNAFVGSVLEPTEVLKKTYAFDSQVVVDVVSIESFCAEQDINDLDILMIDAQGAEIQIMRGLGHHRPVLVHAETAEYQTYKGAGSLEEMDGLMKELGYEVLERMTYDTLYRYVL